MKTPSDNDLDKVYESFNQKHDHLRETLMASLPERSKQHKQTGWVAHTSDFIRGNIMKSRITKLAAAAIIIIAVLIGIQHLGGPIDGAGVAWAQVLKRVEKIPSVVCRMKQTVVVEGERKPVTIESIVYSSSLYGLRSDMYIEDKIVESTYTIPDQSTVLLIYRPTRKYHRIAEPEGKTWERVKKSAPRRMVKQLLSQDYVELEPDSIDGIKVEGIEVKSPRLSGSTFKNAVARLWVSAETTLPVRLELKGINVGVGRKMSIVAHDFEWDVLLDASVFEPNIPVGYTEYSKEDTKMRDASEETMIEGLRTFAEITGGHYPDTMALGYIGIIHKTCEAYETKYGIHPYDDGEQGRRVIDAIGLVYAFYSTLSSKLSMEGQGVPYYYGGSVTANDSDAVLMGWKISDDKYRVIFGDLTTENVTAHQLAELEKASSE